MSKLIKREKDFHMLSKFLKFGLLTAGITLFSNFSNAEDVKIHLPAIESYSKEFNVSSQEAERRLKIQSQLSYIVQKLNDEFGDSIASVYFDNGQDFKLVVRTTKKGNTQRQVLNLAEQLSKDYSLPIEVVANSPRNFKAIQNIIENQKERIAKQYIQFQTIAYNPQHDAIYISFYEPDVTKQNEIRTSLKKLSGMDTIIAFLPKPLELTAGESGGGLIAYTSLSSVCTGGFTGTMNGKLGVLTAAHCVVNKQISSYANNQYQPVTVGTPIIPETTYHEIAFLPLNTTNVSGSVQQYVPISPNVVNSSNTYKNNLPITGIGYAQRPEIVNGRQVAGMYLCHTGQTTGYSCGYVTNIDSSAGTCNLAALGKVSRATCAATYIQLEGAQLKIQGGDSGGPLFDTSGKAYGIATAGGPNTNGIGDSGLFSSLELLSGFTLKTGG